MATWMVRAGRNGVLFDEFVENNIATIGWNELNGVRERETLNELRERVTETWPSWHPNKIIMAAGQLFRFARKICPGDTVVTYDPSSRRYRLGTAKGNYRFDPDFNHEDGGNIIDVQWNEEVPRDDLLPRTKNSLGAISTLFKVPEHAASDLQRVAKGESTTEETIEEIGIEDTEELELTLKAVSARAGDLIADQLSQLSWEDMQDLVAGLLRGLGYKTQVSPKGADRGRDILASPDGFGFQDPRIIVEVKHRRDTKMGAPEIRAFLGGRQDGDKCLYVSTGGFTNEARYEADRARYPLKLMSLDDIAEALQENYEALDAHTKALVPLTRVYWPS